MSSTWNGETLRMTRAHTRIPTNTTATARTTMLVAIVALPLEVSGGRTEVTTLSDCMLGNVQRRPKDKVEAGSRKYSTRAPGGGTKNERVGI